MYTLSDITLHSYFTDSAGEGPPPSAPVLWIPSGFGPDPDPIDRSGSIYKPIQKFVHNVQNLFLTRKVFPIIVINIFLYFSISIYNKAGSGSRSAGENSRSDPAKKSPDLTGSESVTLLGTCGWG
jgi:hypothetical protein